mgnify:FL=1
MAVGLCRMLGFDVKKNFRYPYVARNITTFVRRFTALFLHGSGITSVNHSGAAGLEHLYPEF